MPHATRARAVRRVGGLVAALALAAAPLVPAVPAAAAPSGAVAAAPTGTEPPILGEGATGEAVRVLQEALGIKVTGRYGSATVEAVVAFQQRIGIVATGEVGARTWAALGARAARAAARVTAPEPVDGKVCPTRDFSWGDGWGVARWHGGHMGMDLMGKRGTPIFAIEDGRVIRAGVQSNGALRIVMQGRSGSKYYYGHNSKHLVGTGDRVEAGEVIALMGDTGSPGAVHLHFEYWKSGGESDAVNPEPLLRAIC
jgi:murein DD-endopeptidase MepM/ murein hydrolase activator NlpD